MQGDIALRKRGYLMNAYFIAAAVVCTVSVLWWMIKSEKGGRCFVISAFQGIASAFAVNLLGMVTGVTVSVNWYSLAAFALLGLPGVIGALMMNFITA